MVQPQIVNITRDSVLAFDAENVIDDTTQAILNASSVDFASIQVDITFVDIIDGSASDSAEDVEMTYVEVNSTYPGWWTVDIADIVAQMTFVDRHKYVATVKMHTGDLSNMREFKVHEFTVDNDSFESTLMRLPFQVEIQEGVDAYIRWYEDTTFTAPALFEAEAYQDGVGTTFATRTDRVTHRGPIVEV